MKSRKKQMQNISTAGRAIYTICIYVHIYIHAVHRLIYDAVIKCKRRILHVMQNEIYLSYFSSNFFPHDDVYFYKQSRPENYFIIKKKIATYTPPPTHTSCEQDALNHTFISFNLVIAQLLENISQALYICQDLCCRESLKIYFELFSS